ncbi:hypothetical protein AAES_97884 [Amazona aestiva]|uniref:Uncharacterized protein n=1 Tax=Amazona aestiva TaxID=12930 RepID=A0A0Q3PGT4_AMAAE|nr:hypothetical protein AAES_97884 [Amazona aestiva]
MTWSWCSPAPGLIGPSSGLNAKVSWQREAEEPDFPVPAARAGERQSLRSEERHTGPPRPAISGEAKIALTSLFMEERAGESIVIIATFSYPRKE